MRVLLLYPLFPKTFWSWEKVLELVGRKALLPPLGLITVAAILPQSWEFRLVDRNVCSITEADWDWADLVVISGMIVQKPDMHDLICEAKHRGKRVAVGGPYVTSVPEFAQAAGADYLVLDEGEITLPLFVEALERGETEGIFRSGGEKPDVTQTPIPRFDLLDLDAYDHMSVQFSRGCPFQCEFCDIIVLYGRKPRTKSPDQLLAELQVLYDMGWRRPIFLVDDNFIGNKRNVKNLLRQLGPWMSERNYPFRFTTEASVDLAQDQELLDLMNTAGFISVFLGIETPDTDSLALTKKYQNTRDSLVEAVKTISKSGLQVMSGFIIGFDGEKTGAGQRIVDFVEATSIPLALISMLQALPDTALWYRLQKEGRLLAVDEEANLHQETLTNFVPTRPLEEMAHEFVESLRRLYAPERYLKRTYQHFVDMRSRPSSGKFRLPSWSEVRAGGLILWRQGLKRKTRWQFWRQFFSMLQRNPNVFVHYLAVCAQLEHFLEYSPMICSSIEAQLTQYLEANATIKSQPLIMSESSAA